MKIVVIGGSGLVGAKLVKLLRANRHQVLAASRASGVNAVSGEGLASALEGAEVLVDVGNSPTYAAAVVLEHFQQSGRNLAKAAKEAGVRHHIVLSIVGTDRLAENIYFSAKLAQEEAAKQSGVPYTILRATQFMEFVNVICHASEVDGAIRLPPALMQPVAADDVAEALAKLALAAPLNATVELAGPQQMSIEQAVRRVMAANGESRPIVADAQARYFGSELAHATLVPAIGAKPLLGAIRLDHWLRR